MLSRIIGWIMLIAAIPAGLYLGGWVFFIGGIVQIVEAVSHFSAASALPIAFGVLRIIFAALIGWATVFILFIPGLTLISEKPVTHRKRF